ncbi:MAG: hypothetical protein K8S27_06085 [Candidatus Omnitrophica bacterium]|nr:hypothetical protein [Candidatus Omnitrophota bacterium]
MFYSIIMILRWTGIDLAQRRLAHDRLLVQSVVEDYGLCLGNLTFGMCLSGYDPASYYRGPLGQIDPSFYHSTEMNAVWDDTAPHY